MGKIFSCLEVVTGFPRFIFLFECYFILWNVERLCKGGENARRQQRDPAPRVSENKACSLTLVSADSGGHVWEALLQTVCQAWHGLARVNVSAASGPNGSRMTWGASFNCNTLSCGWGLTGLPGRGSRHGGQFAELPGEFPWAQRPVLAV